MEWNHKSYRSIYPLVGYLGDEAGLVFSSFGISWFGPPSSRLGMLLCRLSNPDICLLLSGGLEGYLMAAVDVCVDVEALARLLLCPVGSAVQGLRSQPVFIVSSLIFGEDESCGYR